MYYCSLCGSRNTFEIDSSFTDGSYRVVENDGEVDGLFDSGVILIECEDCEAWTYVSK